MNEYEIALIVIVRQRGADASDAANRAVLNLGLREGDKLRSPERSNCDAEAGPVMVVSRPNVIMAKPSNAT
jgi:hypothetical protein